MMKIECVFANANLRVEEFSSHSIGSREGVVNYVLLK